MKIIVLWYRSLFSVFVLSSILATSATASIIRVKWDSATDGPGNDWSNAYQTVSAALDAAQESDEIWVAKGTYTGPFNLKSGVALYGGFAGSEIELSERTSFPRPFPDPNETTLNSDNNETVVLVPAGASSTTQIDGFTVRSGVYGIDCFRSSPSITNNTISGGHSGIYCYRSSPFITNNTIKANDYGIECKYSSSPSIMNNVISGNGDAGIYCDDSSPFIANNTISGNSNSGIYCDNYSSPYIVNNTISGSRFGIECVYYSSPSITNNIVAFNRHGICEHSGSGIPVLNNNCVYNPTGSNYEGLDAGAGDISGDPKFISAVYGKLHIQPDSPCIDNGLDSVVQSGWTDMDGQPRIQGAHVDIGADESAGNIWPEYHPVVVRVSPDGVDDIEHDGSNWALAKRTVREGIDAVSVSGGEVWVAAGTYSEQYVALRNYAYVYGGFTGAESIRDERNWTVNRTILDGNGEEKVVEGRGYQVSGLDGFTVRNGQYGIYCDYSSPFITNNTISENSGSGIYCSTSYSSIINNMILDNGVGIDCYYSSPFIVNNTISDNGNGIDCYSSTPFVANNIVAFNGNGIYANSDSDDPVLMSNCVYNPAGINYEGLLEGTTDISEDPMFVDIDAGDYHIKLGSPCIDSGNDTYVGTGWTDIDGDPRIQGVHVDIGADEYDNVSAGYTLSATVNLGDFAGNIDGVPVTLDLLTEDGSTYLRTEWTVLDSGGKFYLHNVEPGIYKVGIKPSHWLRKVTSPVEVTNADVDFVIQ